MAWPIAAIVTRVAPPDMFAMQLGVRVSFAGTESDAKQQRLRRWKYMFSSINNKTTIKRKCFHFILQYAKDTYCRPVLY